MMAGKLFLIPTIISDHQQGVIPQQVREALPGIKHFLAEDVRTARRYLSSLKVYPSMEELNFETLNKETPSASLPPLMKPLADGLNMGVISESGCPGVADPGALAVAYAHEHGFQVVPLVGPSSILLALMASGLNGQQFAFHGYLPIESKEASKKIQELERESKLKNQTQIFIETPYRNNSVFTHLIKNLHPNTRLTVALDITGQQEVITTKPVMVWRSNPAEWPKAPAVFLFLA
ncbi:MAG TPA: SAM-dependent methyltransferase [Cyclobacteriaceae bacterium]|nr:SAM-dependent methyltransferase [Cyclobacteriaceae bacterium]HNU43563.1 SAM-dependent methyltransferase [Cyclobacteriaceae bacterium]